MKKFQEYKAMILFLVQIYCGFIQDSYLTIKIGVITSFSDNRNDPRFIVSDSTAGTSYALAINYNTIWMLKNITGLGYDFLIERSYQPSTNLERSILIRYLDILFYDENLTTLISNYSVSGQITSLGDNQNEVLQANWVGAPAIFQMKYIGNNTVKWSYTILNYTCLAYEIQNSTIISLLFPATPDGTILLDVRTVVN